MRGLLVIEPLYHQIVAGRKTQTRRSCGLEIVNLNPDDWLWARFLPIGEVVREQQGKGLANWQYLFENTVGTKVWCKPRYKVGEVLYLKEPYRELYTPVLCALRGETKFDYKFGKGNLMNYIRYKNKLFMPASAARVFIKITGIKCERLLDISNVDCIAEGIESEGENTGLPMWKNYCKTEKSTVKYYWADATASFLSLYRFANKIREHGHIGNPWVWAYTFEYLKNYKP